MMTKNYLFGNRGFRVRSILLYTVLILLGVDSYALETVKTGVNEDVVPVNTKYKFGMSLKDVLKVLKSKPKILHTGLDYPQTDDPTEKQLKEDCRYAIIVDEDDVRLCFNVYDELIRIEASPRMPKPTIGDRGNVEDKKLEDPPAQAQKSDPASK